MGLACDGTTMLIRPPRFESSIFLRSLRSMPVTALPRYYGRSDSCTARLFGTFVHEHRLDRRAGLPDSRAWPSDHSASKHRTHPVVALARYPSARQASLAGLGFAIG